MKTDYSEKLRDPRWQKMRLKVMDRDEFTCRWCFDNETTLNVHHLYYERGKEPWDYPAEALITLCQTCHEGETDSRTEAEEKLLLVLKKQGLSYSDIDQFACDLHSMELRPSVFASALGEYVRKPDNLKRFFDLYFKILKEKRTNHEGSETAQKNSEMPCQITVGVDAHAR